MRAAPTPPRAELGDTVPSPVVEELLSRLAAEGPRLVQLGRAVVLVGDALGGVRWWPGAVPFRRA